MSCKDARGGSYDRRIKLHLRILEAPVVSTEDMVRAMQRAYSSAGILIEIVSSMNLDLPEFMDLSAGGCEPNYPTEAQLALFTDNREGIDPGEMVVCFVRSTIPPYNGCAVHPPQMPGAVVAKYATKWTLAHEVGHVLGLKHVEEEDRLMIPCTKYIKTDPPLVLEEIQQMQQSGLAPEC